MHTQRNTRTYLIDTHNTHVHKHTHTRTQVCYLSCQSSCEGKFEHLSKCWGKKKNVGTFSLWSLCFLFDNWIFSLCLCALFSDATCQGLPALPGGEAQDGGADALDSPAACPRVCCSYVLNSLLNAQLVLFKCSLSMCLDPNLSSYLYRARHRQAPPCAEVANFWPDRPSGEVGPSSTGPREQGIHFSPL